MKFNHDADKLGDVFPEHDLDRDKVEALIEAYAKEPTKFLGSKKSETAEYLRSIADDPEALIVAAMMLVRGIAAMRVMEALEAKTSNMLKTMDISDMPLEVAQAILDADDAPEEVKERVRKEAKCMQAVKPETAEVADEFEQLKRKYQ